MSQKNWATLLQEIELKVHKQNIIAKDIIVIARQPAKDMNTLEIQSSLEHVLKIAKVFNKKIK